MICVEDIEKLKENICAIKTRRERLGLQKKCFAKLKQ